MHAQVRNFPNLSTQSEAIPSQFAVVGTLICLSIGAAIFDPPVGICGAGQPCGLGTRIPGSPRLSRSADSTCTG
jgi:hypothetical protein